MKNLSGNPDLENGKFWLAGVRGNKPDNKKTMEWFNGPVFSVKKKFFYDDFNFSLFVREVITK